MCVRKYAIPKANILNYILAGKTDVLISPIQKRRTDHKSRPRHRVFPRASSSILYYEYCVNRKSYVFLEKLPRRWKTWYRFSSKMSP